MTRSRSRLAPVLVLASLCGCRGTQVPDPPQTALQRGIFYVERDESGNDWGLSSERAKDGVVQHLADDRPVDLNSSVKVQVKRDQLGGVEQPEQLRERIRALTEKQQKLEGILDDVAVYLGMTAATLDAYWRAPKLAPKTPAETDALSAFTQLRDAQEAVETRVIEGIKTLYPDGEERQRISAAARSFADVQVILRDELDKARRERATLVSRSTYKLRLEAYLRSSKHGVTRVHVPGYDLLPKGDLQPRDRYGIVLDAEGAEEFEEMNQSAALMAAAGNRVLDGEQELEDAFRDLSDTVAGPLTDLAADAVALSERLAPGELIRRIQETRDAIDEFIGELPEDDADGESPDTVAELVAATRDEIARELEALQQSVLADATIAPLLVTIGDLRRHAQDFRPENVPTLIALVERAVVQLKQVERSLDGMLEDLSGEMAKRSSDIANNFEGELRESWDDSRAAESIKEWEQLYTDLLDLVDQGTSLFTKKNFPPLPSGLQVEKIIDIPVDLAMDTKIDLEYTPRREGDKLSVRASLMDGEKPVDTHETDLDVEWLGWHARLDPSVILAKPSSGLAGDANFRFAPAVSWLWSYDPRPGQDGFMDDVFRYTDLSFGPHAALLPFDPNKEVEIGLGFTVGLWNGVLQGGIGYDLMTDNSDGVYYFVGSSLIGIVQGIGSTLPSTSANNATAQ